MNNMELYRATFHYDDKSPSKILHNFRSINPAFKMPNNGKHGGPSYTWYVRAGDKLHKLDNVIYALFYGAEVPDKMYINHVDGDLDNHDPLNFALFPKTRKNSFFRRANQRAYKEFKTVILKRRNPDYFKHPSDWTDPEALQALEEEKLKRASNKR